MPRQLALLCLALATLAACASSASTTSGTAAAAASAPSASRRSDCPLREQDSSFMALGTVYRDCAVDTKAKLTSNDIHPDYRPTQTGCISADVEYVVDEKGMVETKSAHVVRTTKDTFGEAVLSMLPRLRYEPAMRDGVPVRQIVVDHQSMALGVSTTGRAPSKAAGQIPARC